MDKTLQRVKGYKVRSDGAVVHLSLETAGGIEVIVDLVPEMIMELILNLMTARTEAWVRAEGGVPGEIPTEGSPMRMVIKADRAGMSYDPVHNSRLLQVVTAGGAIFEFGLDGDDPTRET